MVRTPTDRRRVPESEIKRLLGNSETPKTERVLAIYARVSSHEQKAKGDLDRQVEFIAKQFDARLYEDIMVVAEVSSGLNDNRKGHQQNDKTMHEELVEDLLAIVTSFSGKLYGIRKKKKESFKRQVKEAIISAVNLPDED
jgi:predicted site-specific integrase-resolvase